MQGNRRPRAVHRWRRVIQLALLVALATTLGCVAPEPPPRRPMPDPIGDIPGEDLYVQGIRLARTGDLLRGEQYVWAAIERGYPTKRALPALLKICIAASRLNAALRYAVPYLEKHPEDHRLRTIVASIHLGLGNIDDAEKHLREAIEDGPEEAPAYYLMGMLQREELGDPAAGDPYLERYLELAPNGVHAAEVRGLLRRRAPIRRIEHIIESPAQPVDAGEAPGAPAAEEETNS